MLVHRERKTDEYFTVFKSGQNHQYPNFSYNIHQLSQYSVPNLGIVTLFMRGVNNSCIPKFPKVVHVSCFWWKQRTPLLLLVRRTREGVSFGTVHP